MKRLLFVGDAGCPTGFARVTHEILDMVRFHYHVTVLGINYRGDPHEYPYPIYAASIGGDPFGTKRLIWMCDAVKPDVIVIQQDGWNIPSYIEMLRRKKPNGEYAFPDYAAIPVVAAVPIDGKNFQGGWLDGVALAVFWTQFALDEARAGGYTGQAVVIPLGVDLKVFYPVPKAEALERLGALSLKDRFIVGNVNRNQPRKRWDLTLRYFAEWIHSRRIDDAELYMHSAPTGDMALHVEQMVHYYDIANRCALRKPPAHYGDTEEQMRDTYNCFDVQITTTQGEGFGLTTLEGMACGVPQIVPAWSALGDWAKGATAQVPCTSTNSGAPYVNVIGGVPDEAQFIAALDALYRDAHHRKLIGDLGMKRAQEDRFRWQSVGEAWVKALDSIFAPMTEEVWQDLSEDEPAVKV